MKLFRIPASLIILCCWISAGSQPSGGYYDPAIGLSGQELQQSLHDIIAHHRVIPYDSLFACFRKTDARNDSVVWDMYSDRPGGTPAYVYLFGRKMECGNYNSEADCYNREHSFPKSWFNDLSPMNSDLFHIYPTDGYVNNRRANYPYGETTTPVWTSSNGSRTGICSWPGYKGIIFEPVDEYKGDFARTFFYMATRYFNEDAGWQGSDMVSGAGLKPWALALLLSWHVKDSVSTKEIKRNNEVYSIQGNRNPFIDRPSFAGLIWGTPSRISASAFREPLYSVFPNPADDHIVFRPVMPHEKCVRIEIFNAQGSSLFGTGQHQGTFHLDLKSVLPGLYFYRITMAEGNQTGTFVKSGSR